MLEHPEAEAVALLAEGVDRNVKNGEGWRDAWVALLAEGVDRNDLAAAVGCDVRSVALLAEGVDRNYYRELGLYAEDPSPSSRRAWIEINGRKRCKSVKIVALLAEGVDRNNSRCAAAMPPRVALLAEGVDRKIKTIKNDSGSRDTSPSSRRAWIEISGLSGARLP